MALSTNFLLSVCCLNNQRNSRDWEKCQRVPRYPRVNWVRYVDNHTESARRVTPMAGRKVMKLKVHTNRANGGFPLGFKVNPIVLLILSILSCQVGKVWANSVPAGNKPTPDPSPYERRVALPDLFLLPPGQTKGQRFEPKLFGLSMICLLGSWNKQSETVHRFYEKHSVFFKERKIAAVAAFSHDTAENLQAWALIHNPSYLIGLAQTEFVDLLKNPKVPSCWLLTQQGQLLKKLILPTAADFESVYQNLKLWTDF